MDSFLSNILSGSILVDEVIRWIKYGTVSSNINVSTSSNNDRSKFVIYFLNYLREQTAHLTSGGCLISATTPCKSVLIRNKIGKENLSKFSKAQEPRYQSQNGNISKQHNLSGKHYANKKQSTPLQTDRTSFLDVTPRSQRVLFNSPISSQYEKNPSPSNSGDRHATSKSRELSMEQLIQSAQQRTKKPKPSKHLLNNDIDSEIKSSSANTSFVLSCDDDFPDLQRPLKIDNQKSRRVTTTLVNVVPKDEKKLSSLKSGQIQDNEENLSVNRSMNDTWESSNTWESNKSRNIDSSNSSLLLKSDNSLFDRSSFDNNENSELYQQPPSDSLKAERSCVTNEAKIKVLVQLYTDIIKACLVPSLATELYFVIQLLTARSECVSGNDVFSDSSLDVLKSLHNAVYFAILVLTTLDWLFLLLDKSSLKLMVDNTRVQEFSQVLHKDCILLYEQRMTKTGSFLIPSPMGGVSFQEDTDNSRNFPNQRSFHLFKTQRDSFYELLRDWDANHLSPNWSMVNVNAECIRILFNVQLDVANYIHFVRLFIAQLLLTCRGDSVMRKDGENEDAMMQLKINNPDKYKRLEKRFTLPSSLGGPSPPPSFPGCQEFFRDFILTANSAVFHQHLLSGLITQLFELYSSEFGPVDVEDDETLAEEREKLISSLCDMRLLAKFAGVVSFLPYHSHDKLPEDLNASYLLLRQQTPPAIDIMLLLTTAVECGRISFTIPWMVEYLAMMDTAACKLNYYQTVFRKLVNLHRMYQSHFLTEGFSYTSLVVVIALGWLFQVALCDNLVQQNIFPDGTFFDEIVCQSADQVTTASSCMDNAGLVDQKVLYLCCPYLGEMRYLLNNFTSGASGSVGGSIRKITPIPAAKEAVSVFAELQTQHELEENFFHNYPTSLKRTVDFVGDRVASRFIKNYRSSVFVQIIDLYRQKYVNPIAVSKTDDGVESPVKISSAGSNNDDPILAVYKECWHKLEMSAEPYCQKLCEDAMNILLAEDTKTQVYEVTSKIALRIALKKVHDWSNLHLTKGFIKKEMTVKGNTSKPPLVAVEQFAHGLSAVDMKMPCQNKNVVNDEVLKNNNELNVDVVCATLNRLGVGDTRNDLLIESPSVLLCALKELHRKVMFDEIINEHELVNILQSSLKSLCCEQWLLINNYEKMLTKAVLECIFMLVCRYPQLWTETVDTLAFIFIDRMKTVIADMSIHFPSNKHSYLQHNTWAANNVREKFIKQIATYGVCPPQANNES